MSLFTLIVEDDRRFRKVLELRLRAWKRDIAITVAETLSDARKILDNPPQRIELMILDQHLPDGMGPSLLGHPALADIPVLAVSADDSPQLPGAAVKAGAHHFLDKRQVSEPLFIPLLEALLERSRIERELLRLKLRQSRLDTVRTLIATLQHEINNPLGAVLGGAFLVRSEGDLGEEQAEALRLIEESGQRIKHVLNELCETVEMDEELQQETKGNEQVFRVPGDPKWEE